jgi:hypothetical protein
VELSGQVTIGNRGWANLIAARLYYAPMGRLYETRNHNCGLQNDRRIYLHDGPERLRALVAEFSAGGT